MLTVTTIGFDIAKSSIPRFRYLGETAGPRSRKMSNKSERPTDCIVARDPMTLKDYPWRPVGSARPRPLLSGDLGPRFSSSLRSLYAEEAM